MSLELDYLILAAHPDDAELHCGGLMLKMRQAGRQVGILDLTRGEAATHGSAEERARETLEANKIVEPAYRENLGRPDGGLRDDDETRRLIVDVVRQFRVKVLVAPHAPCRHPDHTAAAALARAVHFFAGAGGFPSDLPLWRPHRVIYHLEFGEVQPSFVVDISAQFEAKMRAVGAYRSQFYVPGEAAEKSTDIGSRAFYDKMLARHRFYGGQISCEYGEGYVVEGMLRLDDPLRNYLEG